MFEDTYLDVLQGNDATGLLIRGVLEVVETVVVQDEPPSLPRLVATACNSALVSVIV